LGERPNRKLAYAWLNIAASQNNERAIQLRAELTDSLSEAEIAEAQSLSSQILADRTDTRD
jgi:hypothetical protein